MVIWPLDTIFLALKKLLSHPIVLVQSILFNIYQEASLIYVLISTNRDVTVGMVWDLIKWILLALLIFGLVIFICVETFKRVMFAEIEKKNIKTILSNIILTLLILFTYYLIISFALYLFFTVILPIYKLL